MLNMSHLRAFIDKELSEVFDSLDYPFGGISSYAKKDDERYSTSNLENIEDGFKVTFNLAGFAKEDVDIKYDYNHYSRVIALNIKASKGDNSKTIERYYTIKDNELDYDKTEAKMEHGLLIITFKFSSDDNIVKNRTISIQ